MRAGQVVLQRWKSGAKVLAVAIVVLVGKVPGVPD